MDDTKICIIIVNWNAGPQLKTCVDSIIQFGSKYVEKIIVIDNNSVDGSEASVEAVPNVTLIRAGDNLGFGKACNLGVKYAGSDYLLFLNPDAALFDGTLNKVVNFMQDPANQTVGICGVQLLDENGKVSRSCARFPTLVHFVAQSLAINKIPGLSFLGFRMNEWDHGETRHINQVLGAFFFVRRTLFQALNGFDERFFVYFEEVDFSYRANTIGWKCMYYSGAQAFHAGGGTTRQVKVKRLFYSLRSRLLYGFKHYTFVSAWVLLGVTLVFEPLSRMLYCLARGDLRGVTYTILGYVRLWSALPEIYISAKHSVK